MNANPFHSDDVDRRAIWDMLVDRDIKAFLSQDWSMVKNDFIPEGFMGIDAGRQAHPDAWKLNFPDLEAYKKEWLKQAKEFKDTEWGEDPEAALFRITVLRDVEISGDSALVHKKFFGKIQKRDGKSVSTNWQTLYRCRKVKKQWKIAGFTGYMPHFLGAEDLDAVPGKQVPGNVTQHQTAGPYSPVLVVNPGKFVVISGQAAIDSAGNVVGDSIEEQTAYTLENCRKQLASADCSLEDVFKVNVFLADLDHWPQFNQVYKEYFPEPRPVRTTVQSGLLMTLLVEIEMWAVKK